MPIILLRQSEGNTQPRSANVSIKDFHLLNSEVDNNFNNLNNAIELSLGQIALAFEKANNIYDYANTKYSSSGGIVHGDVIVIGDVSSKKYFGIIDCGFF